MQIIPAIDLKAGQCVRLYQGDFEKATIYGDDPADVARRWVAQGARMLHVVDLDGAKAGYPVNWAAIESIVGAVQVPIQLGGGLRSEAAVRDALELGVARVILGTSAIREPEMVAQLVRHYGDRIMVGVDARNGLVSTSGWLEETTTRVSDLVEQMAQIGVRWIIYTDIARDGTLSEPNFDATAALVRPGGPAIIASGGVGKLEHLQRLAAIGVAGVIVGRALYTGDIDLAHALQVLG